MKQVTCERIDDKRLMLAISDFLNNQKIVHMGKAIIPISINTLEETLANKFYCSLPFDRSKLESFTRNMIESRNKYAIVSKGSKSQFKLIEEPSINLQVMAEEVRVGHDLNPIFSDVVKTKYATIKTTNWPNNILFISNFLNDGSLSQLRSIVFAQTNGPTKQPEMQKWNKSIPEPIQCLTNIINEKIINISKAIGCINLSSDQHMNVSKMGIDNSVLVTLAGYGMVNGISEKGKFELPLFQGSLAYIRVDKNTEIVSSKISLLIVLVFA